MDPSFKFWKFISGQRSRQTRMLVEGPRREVSNAVHSPSKIVGNVVCTGTLEAGDKETLRYMPTRLQEFAVRPHFFLCVFIHNFGFNSNQFSR